MNLSLSSILRIVGITLIVIAMAMIPSSSFPSYMMILRYTYPF